MSLADLLTRSAVHRLAGESSLERGMAYAASGTVRVTDRNETRVTATVQGTRRYEVLLEEEEGELSYECSCPVGDEGQFCKHCVAVAAIVAGWLPADEKGRRDEAVADVRAFLMSWKKPALVDLILEQTDEDDRLRDRLLMQVATRRPGGPDFETVRAALHDAINPQGFVDWRQAWDWSQGVAAVIDSISGLLAAGHGHEVVGLSEEALQMLDEASGQVDDSDGSLAPLVERLGDLHLLACEQARIDPAELGQRLVDLELGSEHEAFFEAIDRYADLLGEVGIAAYRAGAEARWAKVSVLAPGERDSDTSVSRFRITHLMERLAARSGSADELVAVMTRDLSHSHTFLRVAEVYRNAGRFDDALSWAEQGLTAFPKGTDSRLVEFAADEHHRHGRDEQAMTLIWTLFEAMPALSSYELLHSHAQACAADWPSWSERAIAFLRRDIERDAARRGPAYRWEGASDRSRLVEILLWRQEVEAAWREAQEGGCRPVLWMRLAELREADHPDESVLIYEKHVELLLARKNNQSYSEAVQLIRRIESAMGRCLPPVDFGAYVTSLRSDHRRLRNFMALLGEAGWG